MDILLLSELYFKRIVLVLYLVCEVFFILGQFEDQKLCIQYGIINNILVIRKGYQKS